MNKFIIWYQLDLAGKIYEMCGSDSVTVFDNRKSNNTIIAEILQFKNLEFRKKHGTIGFKIVKGSILSNTPITQLIKI